MKKPYNTEINKRMMITADWHLRSDKPRCRLDEDWEYTQKEMVRWIVETANNYNADLYIIGDIFDTPTVPARILNMFIEEMLKITNHVYFLAGNHDLPQHAIENINNSSIGIMFNYSRYNDPVINMIPKQFAFNNFNTEIEGDKKSKVLFTHRLVFKDKKSCPPFGDNITASDLLKEYDWTDWIFTGDMHNSFHYEKDGRHVINPGCILRQTADMLDYKPSIYYVEMGINHIEKIELPDDGAMVTDEYLRAEEVRDDRITAFVEGIKKGENISLSITDNIKNAIKKNKKTLEPSIICMIESLVEEAQA